MRRLDLFTVGIIAVCLAAAGVLIYIGVKKFMGGSNDLANNEAEFTTVFDEVDTTDASIALTDITTKDDPANTSTSDYGDDDLDFGWLENETKPTPKTTQPTSTPKNTTSTSSKTNTTTATPKSNNVSKSTNVGTVNTGDFMVLAGSFSKRENADNHVNDLKKKGYNNSRVEIFDKGAFAVVLVDRFPDEASARSLVKELKDKHKIESYVKRKD
jgi:cell division septation protein DedD